MTHATIHRSFNPERSPWLGAAAVVATAATIGIAVLLPAHSVRKEFPVAAAAVTQPADVLTPAPAQLVTLPAVEVVGTRQTKSAANRWTVPAVFKQKG
jgi:hypothetical protein